MSNHHITVGSEKTKSYEIIRSHRAFTFGTVPLDHTVAFTAVASPATTSVTSLAIT